jgi:hypothetical protein
MNNTIVDYIDEMLKNPQHLTGEEWEWVKTIDMTMAQYEDPAPTRRQAEVIIDIYKKYLKRAIVHVRKKLSDNKGRKIQFTCFVPESVNGVPN